MRRGAVDGWESRVDDGASREKGAAAHRGHVHGQPQHPADDAKRRGSCCMSQPTRPAPAAAFSALPRRSPLLSQRAQMPDCHFRGRKIPLPMAILHLAVRTAPSEHAITSAKIPLVPPANPRPVLTATARNFAEQMPPAAPARTTSNQRPPFNLCAAPPTSGRVMPSSTIAGLAPVCRCNQPPTAHLKFGRRANTPHIRISARPTCCSCACPSRAEPLAHRVKPRPPTAP